MEQQTPANSAGNTGTSDFDSIVDKINKNVSEKLKETTASFSTKIDELSDKIPKGKQSDDDSDPDDLWNFGDDDDTKDENDAKANYFTKDDAKKMMESLKKEVGKISKNAAVEVFREVSTQQNQDRRTAEDFPMINQSSTHFDKEFFDLVKKEIQERVNAGRSQKDPYLLYDAAAAVKARSSKWNTIGRQNSIDAQRQANISDGSFSVTGKSNSGNSGPTAEQVKYAESMGLSKDKLIKHWKRIV